MFVIIRKKTILAAGMILICLSVATGIIGFIINDTSSLRTIKIDEEKNFIKWVDFNVPYSVWMENPGS